MPKILIVDDSPSDRVLAGRLLQKEPGLEIEFAGDGDEALISIRHLAPDIVVTDLQMPRIDGLALVEAVKRDFPRLPVILMTARGSEAIAAEALKQGAASYVPKSALAAHLRETVVRVLSAATADKNHSRLMHALAECRCRFVIGNDPELVESLTAHFQEMIRCVPLGDESERLRVGIAVKQALLNGLYHGNLELPLDLDDVRSKAATPLILERIGSVPWCNRSLTLEADVTQARAIFTVRHEGLGFPTADREATFDESHSTRFFMRGIVLMRSIMDEVRFDADGRSVTLRKNALDEPELAAAE